MNKKGEHKIYLGEDGIVYIEMFGSLDRDNTIGTINDTMGILKNIPHNKAKILVTINTLLYVSSAQWRKELVGILNDLYKDPGFEKIAILWPNLLVKTIISFVLGAARIETIKLFSNKESSLKWLNKKGDID